MTHDSSYHSDARNGYETGSVAVHVGIHQYKYAYSPWAITHRWEDLHLDFLGSRAANHPVVIRLPENIRLPEADTSSLTFDLPYNPLRPNRSRRRRREVSERERF